MQYIFILPKVLNYFYYSLLTQHLSTISLHAVQKVTSGLFTGKPSTKGSSPQWAEHKMPACVFVTLGRSDSLLTRSKAYFGCRKSEW